MNKGIGSRVCALAYLGFGLVAVLTLALIMPPYQNPDEVMHFKRVDHISRGGLFGQVFSTTAGGVASPLVDSTSSVFQPLFFHPERKVSLALRSAAGWAKWSDAAPSDVAFPSSAAYPPILYLPAALATFACRTVDAGVVQTLIAARMANGIVAVLIGAAAIALAGAAAPFLLVLLGLPTSLAQAASASHDGALLALCALAVALFVRARETDQCAWPDFLVLTAAVTLVATAKAPYAVLAVLPLTVAGRGLRERMIAAAAVAAAVLLWSALALPINRFVVGPGADPAAQLAFLREHPIEGLRAFLRTAFYEGRHMLELLVGRLGWNDTVLPRAYHVLAGVALVCATVLSAANLRRPLHPWATTLTIAALLVGVCALFPIFYVIWTPPGSPLVTGLSGRYFVPLAFALAAVFPALGRFEMVRVERAATLVVGIFMVLTLPTIVYAVVLRYYLQ